MSVARLAMLFLAEMALWVAPAISSAQSDTSTRRTTARPFLGRIVGVFDREGQPLEGVEILDMVGKASAVTTPTGTLALTFVDTGGSILRLRKLGYEGQLLTVTNRPSDGPITVVLDRSGVVLPVVRSTAERKRAPADTNPKLERNGFYERRDDSGASPMAFVTGDRIQHMVSFGDFRTLTGRDICVSNLYVDGVRVKPIAPAEELRAMGRGVQARNVKRHVADQILNPAAVLAIENYRVGEMPEEYNQTKGQGSSHDCGATLIWTK